MVKLTYSGGGVVVNRSGEVLVVNQNGDSWSLPKGHIEPGENVRQAAVREIEEESGVSQLDYIKYLGKYQRHQIGRHGGENKEELKTIEMFLYVTNQHKLSPTDPQNPEARWIPLEQVETLLTHPRDKEFFRDVKQQIAELIAS